MSYWNRSSDWKWINRTFKPVCHHPPDRIVLQMHYGEKRSVCMKCGRTIASQRLT